MQTDLFGASTGELDPTARPSTLDRLARRVHRSWPWLATLKARLLVGGLLALWVSIAVTAWQMAGVAERELLAQADRRELQELRDTTVLLGHRLQNKQRALQVAASTLDATTLADPARLAAHFEQRPLLRSTFSTLFVARPDGSMSLFVDSAGARKVGTNLADRAYFQRTLAERRPVISEVVPSRISNQPVVIFTQPLVLGGQVQAVLGGALRLDGDELMQLLVEDQGAGLPQPEERHEAPMTVVTDAAGQMLTHPQRDMLLQPLHAEPRLKQAQALLDAEGAATRAAAAGAEVAPSARRVWPLGEERVAMTVEPLSGWRVWRVVSHEGVLAPLQAAWRAAVGTAALATLALTALLGAFLVWQLRPLAQLQQRAHGLLQGDQAETAGADAEGWPEAAGEIGELSRTLRHVWAERAQIDRFNTEVLQRLGSVMAASPVGLAFTRFGHFELVSAELCSLLQRPEVALLGAPAQLIFASNEDYAALGPQVAQAFGNSVPYVGEWRLLRADGSSFWARLRARPVQAGQAAAGTIWSINDISEQVQQRQQLQHAAQHDALTGVLNRHGFEAALQPLFTRFNGQPGQAPAPAAAAATAAVVMIDLDHFKPINDTAGHAAGDAMLVAVARSILAQVRGTDVLARLGGDEFALLLPGCDQVRALAVAEKVRQALCQLALRWEGHSLRIGASLGVASLHGGHASAADWLAEADAACYEAKRQGRNAVCGPGAAVRSGHPGLRVVA